LTRVIDDMMQPNGIIGTPDGKKLASRIFGQKTFAYDINADGTLEQGAVCRVRLGWHDD
jgi:gluconolactonase